MWDALADEAVEGWDDPQEAYLGYTQCRKCYSLGHWEGECPRYPYTEGKGRWKGKSKEKSNGTVAEKGKDGKGFGESKCKSTGYEKKGPTKQSANVAEEECVERRNLRRRSW